MTKRPHHPFRLVVIALLVSLMIPALAAAQNQPIATRRATSSFHLSSGYVDPAQAAAANRSAEIPPDRYYERRAWLAGLRRKAATEATAHPATMTTRNASAPPSSGSVNWYAIASCESGGRWDLNTGNGYWGGLQFAPHSWFAGGGGPFSGVGPFPYSAAQQIAVAQRIYGSVGLSAWPYCGRFG